MPIWATAVLSVLLITALLIARRLYRRAGAGSAALRGLSEGLLVLLVGYSAWLVRETVAGRVAPESSFQITLCAYLIVSAGTALLYLWVWRLYRPHSAIAGAAAALGAIALGVGWCGQALGDRGVETTLTGPWGLLFVAAQGVVMCWWGTESLQYHARMKKLVALELADAVVTDRFRVIAHAALSLACVFAVVGACPYLLGRPPREVPLLIAAISICSGYATLCLYCALGSPAFYERYVRTRATSVGLASS